MDLPAPEVVLQLQVIPTAAMFGVIWMTQLVTYPGFLQIERESFRGYHAGYTRSMGFVVIPLMVAELGLALLSAWQLRETLLSGQAFALAGLAALAWLVTFTFQVPAHLRLGNGYSEPHVRRLIRTNWIRTAIWTTRLGLLCAMIAG